MKSLVGLWKALAADAASMCSVSTTRDEITVTRRVETEGLSFLTITLPAFASDFERSLELGRIDSDLFAGFGRRGGLPKFLSGFLRLVFDSQSGVLLQQPNIDSIIAVRQLCTVFKKIEIPCTSGRTKRAMEGYLQCEMELKELDRRLNELDLSGFRRMASLLFGDVMTHVSRDIDSFTLRPKHGPGMTSDRLLGNQKWNFPEWHDRLDSVFPFTEYGVPNHRYADKAVNHISPGDERPVQVVFVPKTLKAPRVIAMEPTVMQYAQQGIAGSLVSHLERVVPSRWFIGFKDQEPNRLMACAGSRDGSLATLDLSEASDRVLNSLVIEMARPFGSFHEGLQASRSRTARLANGTEVRLSKFASMGSALCFPIEAMVFTTIVFLGIQDAEHRRLLPRDFVKFRGKVRVYGDDIIVPAGYATFVIKRLESFGLKVNATKSFWSGNFRESCGGDYYSGEWVTPIRLKQVPPKTKADAVEVIHWFSFANELHSAGYWKAADYAAELLRGAIGLVPVHGRDSNALALKSFTGFTGETRWDRRLHRPLTKGWVVRARSPKNEIQGVAALHKAFTGDWSDPVDRDHLLRSGRPSRVNINVRWVPAE